MNRRDKGGRRERDLLKGRQPLGYSLAENAKCAEKSIIPGVLGDLCERNNTFD